MAAAEAGNYAYDGAFADIRDSEGFSAEARLSRGLGFLGKTCIHPSQVALANAVYQPTAQEIEHSLKVVDAAREADANALGAYVVDGKMVDKPFVLRAQAIVAAARAQGLLAA
jgi:citrate lyase subunit beta/citryl-CoA lyase